MDVIEFERLFLKSYAKNISKEKLVLCNVNRGPRGCLWNLFGYHLVNCSEGKAAVREYNKVDKSGATVIMCERGILYELSLLSDPKNTDLLFLQDIDYTPCFETYVIGSDFTWCLVLTHCGSGAGPYFAYKAICDKNTRAESRMEGSTKEL